MSAFDIAGYQATASGVLGSLQASATVLPALSLSSQVSVSTAAPHCYHLVTSQADAVVSG